MLLEALSLACVVVLHKFLQHNGAYHWGWHHSTEAAVKQSFNMLSTVKYPLDMKFDFCFSDTCVSECLW